MKECKGKKGGLVWSVIFGTLPHFNLWTIKGYFQSQIVVQNIICLIFF